MKTKQYTFTISEIIALRDACIERYQMLRQAGCNNNQVLVTRALADQFKDDCRLWKE